MSGAKYTQSAGGVVVNEYTGDVLVVNQNHNSWSLPKGHIDKGEDALLTAKREIFEESGITHLELLGDLGKYKRFRIGKYALEDESEIKTIQLFLFVTDQTTLTPHDKANPEARWVPKKEVAKLLTHKKDIEFYLQVLPQFETVCEIVDEEKENDKS